MKKKLLLIISIVAIFISVIFLDKLLFCNNNIEGVFNDLSQIKFENTLSMMLEQNAGAGDYELETRPTWPTKDDGYIFNATLSKCENGSKLSWDEDNNAVVMVGNTSDKCYVYFDKVLTLTAWVKSQYTGTQGENNLYYHNGTILGDDGTVLDAGDSSYRYAGANPNNYVCFGSDAEACPDDNLYRIIGVFGNQVKLIKWDYATTALLGTDGDYSSTCASNLNCNYGFTNNYYKGSNTAANIGAYWWNNDGTDYGTNTWSASELNTVNLNTNFLKNIGSTWASKIATTTWKVGGNTSANVRTVPAATAYTNEYISPSENTTETKKIGLMYLSDYGFAAASSAWTTNLDSYDSSSITTANWMYMGLYEWTVVRRSDLTYGSFGVDYYGYVCNGYVGSSNYAWGLRPVFYLESSINYVSGDGTKISPVRLS